VTFERPDLLSWLPLMALLLMAGVLWQWRRSLGLAEAFGGREPTRRLTGRRLDRFPTARLVCLLLAATALVLAASGVQRDTGEPPPPPTPVDLVIALDVSHSMTGTDVEPSRFDVARGATERVFQARLADRVALTLFAAWPYGLVPMTDDPEVVDYFMPWIEPELVERRDQGTALAAAVTESVERWRTRERDGAVPVLLVVSDGETHGPAAEAEVMAAAESAAAAGLRIWTAGVGSAEGAPLFVPGSSAAPLMEGSGGQVVAGYAPDLLREVARAGGGRFHELTSESDADELIAELRALRGGADSADEAPFDPTVLLLGVALALLATDAILDSGALSRRRETVVGDEGHA